MTAHIHRKDDPRVFVFGSNLLGIHAGGAAAYAQRELGAKHGRGEGPMGRAYALPTCSRPGLPMSIESVGEAVENFIAYAILSPSTRFFVSEVGCGIAGFKPEQIAPLFADSPSNCDLPPGWREMARAAVAS